jgi:hypothetical protein
MTNTSERALKRRVTMRQIDGDDGYCWAVMVDGRVKWDGMQRREATWRRDSEIAALQAAELLTLPTELVRELNRLADYLAQDSDTVEGGVSDAALAEMVLDRLEGAKALDVTALIKQHGYDKVHAATLRAIIS